MILTTWRYGAKSLCVQAHIPEVIEKLELTAPLKKHVKTYSKYRFLAVAVR